MIGLLFAMSNKGESFNNFRFLGFLIKKMVAACSALLLVSFLKLFGFLLKTFWFPFLNFLVSFLNLFGLLLNTFCLFLKTFWGMFDQNGGCCAGNKKPSPSSICATSQNDKKEFHFNVHFQRRTK